MKTNVRNLMMMAIAAAMTACSSNTDIFNPGQIEQDAKASYAENFVKQYPNVNLNQSWDYSNKVFNFSLPGQGTRTRAVDYNVTKPGYYEIDNSTLAWLQEKLPEAENNKALGAPFIMTVPGNEFTIIPIYQGGASAKWNLHMVVGDQDILVWQKSEGIQVKDDDNSEWHDIHYKTNPNNPAEDPNRHYEMDINTMYANNVQAQQYTYKNLPVGEDMYFYLEVTVSGNGWWDGGDGWREHKYNSVGTQQSSIKSMMLALQDVPRPANISEDNEVMLIACEDADEDESDWDYNDVVFLVYGKHVPQPLRIEPGTPVVREATVRYMIEDLGSTDDFDFNDIVLDVTETHTATPVYKNDVFDSWKDESTTQKAVIRHLGGTLPFILTIGNTTLEEHEGVLGSDPNEEYTVTGWDINQHNVSVKVQQKDNEGVYNNVKFPKAGEAPMIIAVDPTTQWMGERVHVPAEWFYIPGQEQ